LPEISRIALLVCPILIVIYFNQEQKAARPFEQEWWSEFEEFYSKKLWHQVTLKVCDYVKTPSTGPAKDLMGFYENFIADFESKISPLTLIEIIVYVLKQITSEYERSLEFIGRMKEKVRVHKEASILCSILAGQLKLAKGDLPGMLYSSNSSIAYFILEIICSLFIQVSRNWWKK